MPDLMDDYIERKAAIRALTMHDCDSAGAKIAICDLPAADVAQVRHGRWETISDQEYVVKDFSCSECEELICDFDTTVLWPGQNCYYYCPNCGAKMDGGEQDA